MMDPLSFLLWRFPVFFRDPERTPPPGPVIVSPADGRILYVDEVAPGAMPTVVKQGCPIPIADAPLVGPAELPGVLIGIYMYPWSVHVNRAPVAGKVSVVNSRPAKQENQSMVRALMHLFWKLPITDQMRAAVADNARNTLVIEGNPSIAMVQIADRFVNQVDCFVRPGQDVAIGERVGMIRMGSQCDLFFRRLPGMQVTCKPGQLTRGGETVLARY
jgi:phosphatidylserine decarboxylase